MDYFGKKLHVKDTHLYWENDQPFFLLADTLWYGLTARTDIESFTKIIKKRKEQGFTAIQLVVGTPPEISIFETNARSTSGEFMFYNNNLINPKYFEDIQKKIEIVVQHNLVPILYGSWGNYIDITGVQSMKDMWTYIVKTFDAYPVIYCLCGEADIFPPHKVVKTPWIQSLTHKIKGVGRVYRKLNTLYQQHNYKKRISDWTEVAEYLTKINKESHPITAHISTKLLATDVFENNHWMDINSFQSGHSPEGLETMAMLFNKAQTKQKPFVNLEPLYEGIMGQLDTRLQVSAFWQSIAAGALGHVYGAHGLWQMANDDNFMAHWGNSDWNKALTLPGAEILGKSKKFILSQQFDWTAPQKCTDIEVLYNNTPQYPEIKLNFAHTALVYIPDTQNVNSIDYNDRAKASIIDSITCEIIRSNIPRENLLHDIKKCKNALLMFEPS